MQRDSTPYSIQHSGGIFGRQTFDQHSVLPVTDGEENVLPRDVMEIFHDRQCCGAKPMPAGRERSDLQQMKADREVAVVIALEGPQVDELTRDSGRRTLRKAGSCGEDMQGQTFTGCPESAQDSERSRQDSFT